MSILSLEVQNKVGILTIKSPPANALSTLLLKNLDEKLKEISEDRQIKAVILKGEGRFFSAGADIKEFTSLQSADDFVSLAQNGQQLFNRMEQFHIPIIAAIHGAALGGGLELAMACHMRIVTNNAKIGLPELSLGIIPGFAGTQRLPQYVGTAKAYEMMLTAQPISGEDAFKFGLANQVVADDDLFTTAQKLAEQIAEKSGPSIHKVMELVPYAKTTSFNDGVNQEAKAFGEVFGSEDAKEGAQAFIEKRKPNFQDK